MVRFISCGSEYKNGQTTINRFGVEVTDKKEITRLRSSPDFGSFFYEVMSEEKLKEETLMEAKKLLTQVVPVAPVESGDIEEEEKAYAENESIKKAQEEFDSALKAAQQEIGELKRKKASKK